MSRKRKTADPPQRVYVTYDHHSAFFWKGTLTPVRKDQIIAWVDSLPDEQRRLLNDIIEDVRLATEWDMNETFSSQD